MRRSRFRPAVIAAALVAAAWLVAIAFGDSAFDQNDAANERYARGDFTGALSTYRELLRRRPELAEVAVNAGNAVHELSDYARALGLYEGALGARDAHVRALAFYDRGNTLYRLDRLEEARASYVDALRLEPDMRDAKFNIEVIDQQLEQVRQQRRQGGKAPPPGQQPPGGQQQPGLRPPQGGGRAPGQQQPGQQQPGQQPAPPDAQGEPGRPPALNEALGDFRRDISVEEALRVLDALRGEQRGVRTLIEGDPRRGQAGDARY